MTNVPADEASEGIEAVRAELAAVRCRLEDSERERASLAKREKALRQELQHRARNILAVIRSVFSRTVDSASSLEDMDNHFRGRLDVLARHQSTVGASAQSATDLEGMIRGELQNFEFDERIVIAGPDVELPVHLAQSLRLAIHELATNSIKFGALSRTDARARLGIEWTCRGDRLNLSWIETGVPVLAPAPVKVGFGREFIEQGLPYQLGAATTFRLQPGGLSCTIETRLGEDAERPLPPRNWF